MLAGSGKIFLICVTLAATASVSVAADFYGNEGFFAAFGGEYQYISQEYYNALVDTSTLDVIETWRLDQDEINDFILKTNLGYNFQNQSKKLALVADMQLSGDRFLGRSEGSFRLGNYDNNLKLFGKFESKSPYGDDEMRVEEYDFYQTYLSGRRRLGVKTSLSFKAGYELVSFSDESSTVTDIDTSISYQIFPNYDYSILSGWIGGEFELSEFTSELSWRAGYNRRLVPDSAEAEYDQYRFGLQYSYFGLGGMVNLEGEIELRDYMQLFGRDDFMAMNFRGYFNRALGERYELGGAISTDIYDYELPDIVNRNYVLFRCEIEGTMRPGSFGWGPLLRLEYRGEDVSGGVEIETFSEDYIQWEGGMHSEFLNQKAIFLDSEISYGYRNYNDGSGFLSSYHFWSISVMANYSLFKNLSFNFMFDGAFESHEVKEEDTNLYLLSVGVTARI